jgi:hypothetical protein
MRNGLCPKYSTCLDLAARPDAYKRFVRADMRYSCDINKSERKATDRTDFLGGVTESDLERLAELIGGSTSS